MKLVIMNTERDISGSQVLIIGDSDDVEIIDTVRSAPRTKERFPCSTSGCNSKESTDNGQPEHMLLCLIVKILEQFTIPNIHIDQLSKILSKRYSYFSNKPIKDLIQNEQSFRDYKIVLNERNRCVLIPNQEVVSLDTDDEDNVDLEVEFISPPEIINLDSDDEEDVKPNIKLELETEVMVPQDELIPGGLVSVKHEIKSENGVVVKAEKDIVFESEDLNNEIDEMLRGVNTESMDSGCSDNTINENSSITKTAVTAEIQIEGPVIEKNDEVTSSGISDDLTSVTFAAQIEEGISSSAPDNIPTQSDFVEKEYVPFTAGDVKEIQSHDQEPRKPPKITVIHTGEFLKFSHIKIFGIWNFKLLGGDHVYRQ